jgi:formylglycine-generating enzyme required for sulfatase activity
VLNLVIVVLTGEVDRLASCKLTASFSIFTSGLSILMFMLVGYLFLRNNPSTDWSATIPIPGSMMISSKDGMFMIYIPAGDFLMGDSRDIDSSPPHRVFLDAYWIDQTEVTNLMYSKCVDEGECVFTVEHARENIHFDEPAYANDPVVYVTWYEAADYCRWAGRWLPTEAEWEKAARGTDVREFPWGNALPDRYLLNYDNIIGDTTPVGSYLAGASPYGVLDMAGNVREWVADWYNALYYKKSPQQNPLGPDTGEMRVLRGGSFLDNFQRFWWRESGLSLREPFMVNPQILSNRFFWLKFLSIQVAMEADCL